MAAALLHHFPKVSEPLATRLTQTLCRWSDIGLGGASLGGEPVLGMDCCESILQALFSGDLLAVERPQHLRLRIALTLLTAAPADTPGSPMRGAIAERAALRCADMLASWLMSESAVALGSDDMAAPDEGRLSYDNHQRLTLQTLAWPLCAKVVEIRPDLASRALCFLFFCSTRLPCGGSDSMEDGQTSSADLRWRDFLCTVFSSFIVSSDAISDHRSSGGHGAVGMLTSLLYNPSVPEGGEYALALKTHAVPELVEDSQEATKRLAQMFVSTCMRAISASCRPVAYELLAKLSVERLVTLCDAATSRSGAVGARDADGDEAMGDAGDRGGLWMRVSVVAHVLSSLISYRNECSLPTDAWGTTSLGIPLVAGRQDFSSLNAGEVREVVRAKVKTLGASSPGFEELSAVLPLL